MSAPPADGYLGGKVRLTQAPDGYRAGIDAALLAAALELKPGAHAAEFGCGAGAAILSAAVLNPDARFAGVERDPAALGLAQRNVALNGLGARISLHEGDALSWRGPSQFDAVFFNPPFFDNPGALRAPKPGKASAWLNEAGLAAWIDAGLKRLKEGGVLTLIHRADALAAILAGLEGRAGDAAVMPVHPRSDAPAKRVLVAARKVSKAPLRILPALTLHPETGPGYTREAEAVLTGAARLALHPG
ncbi:MAG: tRNA1(Val) (adenine(37)-N6)-methyltransferase [Oceanicaulis sp.]